MGSVSVRQAGICLFVLLLAGIVGNTAANIPLMMSYQGKVTDSGGSPVADGSYNMRFRIYDAATAGTLEWDSGVQSVQVTDGVFNVLLGESPQPALTLYFDEDYWLLVTFAGVNQSPRQQLASVGYAYMASGLVPGTLIEGSVTTVTNSVIKAVNTATSGTRYGGWFETDASEGRAVYGFASHSSGTNYGGKFHSHSTNGIGVYGKAEATIGVTCGGRFESASTSGGGVYGSATASTGSASGVCGTTDSSSGYGVYGRAWATTGSTHGVYGRSYSTSGKGVHGYASATTGQTDGVSGTSDSSTGYGVYGYASATTGDCRGGAFESASTSGYGVLGTATASTGFTKGVYGHSISTGGSGVYGVASALTGGTIGGCFQAYSPSGCGVDGFVAATSGINYGVHGMTYSSSGYGVYYVGGLGGSGLMNSVVMTSQGPTSLDVHTTAGNWVEDFGEARLVDGRARVELDPVFLETVTIDETNPMHVFVQPYDAGCAGLIVERNLTEFRVVASSGDSVYGLFSYRVVAKKKGFEGRRLDVCEAATTDPYLYPELRQKRLEELVEERARMKQELLRIEEARARIDEERARDERE